MTAPHYNARAESYETSAERPTDWRDDAACLGTDPELFFAPEREGVAQKRAREAVAKSMCKLCEVRTDCLGAKEAFGIWGGESEDPRVRPAPEPVPVPLTCGVAVGSEAGLKRHCRAGEHGCARCLAGSATEKSEREERKRGDRIPARVYMATQVAS